MSDPKTQQLFGRIAIHLKLITMDQLTEAIRQQENEGGQLGSILVKNSWVTPEGLEQILKYQKDYLARRKDAAAHSAKAPSGAKPATAASAKKAAASKVGVSTAPVPPAVAAAAMAAGDRGRIDALLARAVEKRVSDVHVHSGAPIKMRLHGEIVEDSTTPLPAAEAEAMLVAALEPQQRELFEKHGEIDFAYTLPGVGRFRANIYRQHRGVDGVFRVIPPAPPTLADLGLPAALAKVVNFHQGLVLLTGPAGCGKSSTLAALVDILNTERRDHILSIEDPIEHLHPSKRCVVNQRQVSRHTESFARALRAALREDPDIIVIGELRDRETISLALTAAETGHLVLGTLHTNSAIRTINRILGVFPPNQQSQIRTMISESLKAIVSQRLIRANDGKRRVAALEILMCNRAVGNLIREGKTFQLLSLMQTGAPQGMCLMDASLAALVKAGTISKEAALRLCDDPKRLAA